MKSIAVALVGFTSLALLFVEISAGETRGSRGFGHSKPTNLPRRAEPAASRLASAGFQAFPLYDVVFLCSDCGRFHATKLSVTVIDGPDRRKQINEVYSPRAMPPEVTELLRTDQPCDYRMPGR
jgi:hypothetical protein